MRRRTDHKTLESWKAIANYLNRSVRTVRRWETYEGLPVHRHQHTRGASVYAYPSELDEWRGRNNPSQGSPQQKPQPPATTQAESRFRFAPFAAIASLVIALGTLGAYHYLNNTAAPPADSSVAWVIVAEPVTSSSTAHVADTLSTALRREIGKTDYRNALPKNRVRSALELMRLDADTPLDTDVARDVALRDGEVSALIIPRVEVLGSFITVSAEIIDPHSGVLIAYPSEDAVDTDQVITAVQRLAEALGEDLRNLPELSTPAIFPAVTTSSMNALELYVQAQTLLLEDLPAAARELLRLAVDEDPEFASAMALQAWASHRSGDDLEVFLPLSRAAAELASGVSREERYFIEGSHRLFSGKSKRAAADLQALVELRPKDVLALQATLKLCRQLTPGSHCAKEKTRLAELRPDHFESNLQAAWALAASDTDRKRADEYADRSLALLQTNVAGISPESAARAHMYPAVTAWAAKDLELASQQSDLLLQSLPRLAPAVRNQVTRQLIALSLSMGRLKQARELLVRLDDPAERHEFGAAVMFASGNKKGLKEHLASGGNYEEQFTALLLSMAGFPEQAQALYEKLEGAGMRHRQSIVVRAIVALGAGQPGIAKQELQSVVDSLTADDQAYYFVGPDMLANIIKGEGNLVGALSVLETTAPRRIESAYNSSGLFWMMCQRQLARLYREAGRNTEANRIEKELRKLLRLSDEDFPLAQSLKDA